MDIQSAHDIGRICCAAGIGRKQSEQSNGAEKHRAPQACCRRAPAVLRARARWRNAVLGGAMRARFQQRVVARAGVLPHSPAAAARFARVYAGAFLPFFSSLPVLSDASRIDSLVWPMGILSAVITELCTRRAAMHKISAGLSALISDRPTDPTGQSAVKCGSSATCCRAVGSV